MAKFKSALLATLIVASPFAASSAFASSYQYWNGAAWVANTPAGGDINITGPTTATVAGIPVPCTANFKLNLTNGVAKVSYAKFSGTTACTNITTNIPPTGPATGSWPVTAPAAIAGSTSVSLTISGISVTFSNPPATCTGSASGTILNANPNSGTVNNSFTFTAPLSPPCTSVKSNPSLTFAAPIRAVFP